MGKAGDGMGCITRRLGAAAAIALGVTLVATPPASGQLIQIGNSGGGSATTGGNTSTGNGTDNQVGAGSGVVSGGLLGLGLPIGGPTNNSTGGSTVQTGGASAAGNQSSNSVGSGAPAPAVVAAPLPVAPAPLPWAPAVAPQGAAISNAGEASANTGGNESVGNASTNNVGGPQVVQGGLLGVGLNLGGPTNASTGNSNVATGAAQAAGSQSENTVNQGVGHHGGLCPAAGASITNQGAAEANTGGNQSVGNASTNNVGGGTVVQGGLIGLGLNLGGPTNFSSGGSTVNTGGAQAVGNNATNTVNQCVAPLGPPLVHVPVHHRPPLQGQFQSQFQAQFQSQFQGQHIAGQLAKTGFGSLLGVVALALLLLVWGSLMLYRPAAAGTART